MIQRRDLLLSDVVDQLAAGTPVAFSRWGDGEWSAILGKSGQNCDGHVYTTALLRDLTQVLEARPTYYLGLQNAALRRYGPEIEAWLQARKLDLPWVPADLWHQASIKDQLEPFLAALQSRGVIMVGPDRLDREDLLPFPLITQIHVPDTNCHEQVQSIVADLEYVYDIPFKVDGRDPLPTELPVIALSASMSANVIVHRVHQHYPDATLLDLGSLWEPYVGLATRAYHYDVRRRLQAARQP